MSHRLTPVVGLFPSQCQVYRRMSQHSTAELTTSFGGILVRFNTSFTKDLGFEVIAPSVFPHPL
jgi:hypothetical protein